MELRTYATSADYEQLAEEPFDGTPEKRGKRLRSASIEVEKLTRRASYATDADGYPTDAAISDAFTEATCAIVEHWEITDDPTGAITAEGAVSIGSVSLGTTSSSRASSSERERLTGRIGDRAIDILTNAGLLNTVVSHT